MNTVITIGRQFGSSGRRLGYLLAQHLGYAYYDKEILKQIVDETQLSQSYVNDILEGKTSRVFPITFEQTMNVYSEMVMQPLQEVYRAQTEVIEKMATKSNCVIVGRCADFILKTEDVKLFKLFIYADLDNRIQRCIDHAREGEDTSYKAMKKEILKIDKSRARYYEDYTLRRWGDKENYDICINTTNMNVDEMVPHLAKLFE